MKLRRILLRAAFAGALVGMASPAVAVPYTLLHTFDDPDPAVVGSVGSAVALDGNTVVLGDQTEDSASGKVGQVHLFDASTGGFLRSVNDPRPTSNQFFNNAFGRQIDIDGGKVLVGDPGDSPVATLQGGAHLFDANTGALLQTFDTPTPTGTDQFGAGVAISGNRVLVGAFGFAPVDLAEGAAYLFDATTGALLRTFFSPAPAEGEEFGARVAMDGNNVLISSINANATGDGEVHLFDGTTGNLLQTFNSPSPDIGDRFGFEIAIDGNNVLIGASEDDTFGPDVGQAHLFDASTGALLRTFNDPTITGGDRFGLSVAVLGTLALIGAPGDSTFGPFGGEAHLFDILTGNLIQTFTSPTQRGFDGFGGSVALSGNTILIGAGGDGPGEMRLGQAHLFVLSPRGVAEPPLLPLLAAGLLAVTFRRRSAARGK